MFTGVLYELRSSLCNCTKIFYINNQPSPLSAEAEFTELCRCERFKTHNIILLIFVSVFSVLFVFCLFHACCRTQLSAGIRETHIAPFTNPRIRILKVHDWITWSIRGRSHKSIHLLGNNATMFSDHRPRRGWGVNVMPRSLSTHGKHPVPIV
jgi:hypothetical protein